MYHPKPGSAEADQVHARITELMTKTLDEVLQQSDWPVGNRAEFRQPSHAGVLRIDNIPYSLTRQEVIQMLGRGARLIHESQCPVHIIMERSTGKTMRCFVEFEDHKSAQATVDHLNASCDPHVGPRMANRHVDVSISSQKELMEALFPMAKCLVWANDRFVSRGTRPDEWWSAGFNGFLTDEELFCVLRHAKEPHRSAFAGKVPQRVFESIISTVWKFPWFAVNMYTVHARKHLFETLVAMVRILYDTVSNVRTVGLDYRLVVEMVQTGLRCPGFNPRMKYALVECACHPELLDNMSREALTLFPFDTLTWLSPFDVASLTYYGMLMSRGRASQTEKYGLNNTHNSKWIRPYGQNLFEWNDEVSKTKIFADAIAFELAVFRSIIIAGHGNDGTNSRVTSVGTAPPRSPPRTVASTFTESRITSNNQRSGNGRTSSGGTPSFSHFVDDFLPPRHISSQSVPSVSGPSISNRQSRSSSTIFPRRRPNTEGDGHKQ